MGPGPCPRAHLPAKSRMRQFLVSKSSYYETVKYGIALFGLLVSVGLNVGCGQPLTVDEFVDAAGAGDARTVRRGLADEIDVEALSRDGFTALGVACFAGHTEIVRILLDHGASPNPLSPKNNPVFLSASSGHADALELVLARGGDPEPGPEVDPPLGFAANGEVAELLIQAGAEVNKGTGMNNDTPLHRAAAELRADVVEVLLKHGADASKGNQRGITALMRMWITESTEFLDDPAEKTWRTLRALLDAGADPNSQDIRGNTALHYLARNVHATAEMVHEIVKHGASLQTKSASGRTPYQMGRYYGRPPNDPVMVALRGDLSEEAAEAQIPREERRSMPPALGRAAATTQ